MIDSDQNYFYLFLFPRNLRTYKLLLNEWKLFIVTCPPCTANYFCLRKIYMATHYKSVVLALIIITEIE